MTKLMGCKPASAQASATTSPAREREGEAAALMATPRLAVALTVCLSLSLCGRSHWPSLGSVTSSRVLFSGFQPRSSLFCLASGSAFINSVLQLRRSQGLSKPVKRVKVKNLSTQALLHLLDGDATCLLSGKLFNSSPSLTGCLHHPNSGSLAVFKVLTCRPLASLMTANYVSFWRDCNLWVCFLLFFLLGGLGRVRGSVLRFSFFFLWFCFVFSSEYNLGGFVEFGACAIVVGSVPDVVIYDW